MKKFLLILSAVFLLFGMSQTVGATTFTLDSATGTWDNVVGGTNVNFPSDVAIGYGNGLEDQVRWGIGANGQSGLGFTGIVGDPDAPDDIDIFNDVAFEVGQLQHFNNVVNSGTAASAADLDLLMVFSNPAGNSDFIFTFNIDETPNAPGPPASDDIIGLPEAQSSNPFFFEDAWWTLNLLGFGPDADTILESFRSPEGGTNATMLWAVITESNPPAVPEPATMLLLGCGLIGLAGYGRKKYFKKG